MLYVVLPSCICKHNQNKMHFKEHCLLWILLLAIIASNIASSTSFKLRHYRSAASAFTSPSSTTISEKKNIHHFRSVSHLKRRSSIISLLNLSTNGSDVTLQSLEQNQEKRKIISTTISNSGNDIGYDRFISNRSFTIQYKSWTGSRGMLPLQKYHNPMHEGSFIGWLQKPLPCTCSISHNGDNNDNNPQDIITTITNKVQIENMKNRNRQDNKVEAEMKASQPLDPRKHLLPVYIDSHIVVVNKLSGVLSVPGSRRNPSVGGLVHEYFGNLENDVDCMVVHRLDMDTSGIIIYARSKHALSILHDAFRSKSQSAVHNGRDSITGKDDEYTSKWVSKTYVALVCGHMPIMEGEIDFPLMRDIEHPPFMKVWTGDDNKELLKRQNIVSKDKHKNDCNNKNIEDNSDVKSTREIHRHPGYIKMMSKAPKPSKTIFRVIGKEFLDGSNLPVTRVELIPITGRTHQLRVHCAAIGHPIVGDNIYGMYGDGPNNGGFKHEDMLKYFPQMASISVQDEIYNLVQERKLDMVEIENNTFPSQENYRKNTMNRIRYNGDLSLHARALHIQHPITKAPLSFTADPLF
mmetsp:Transcript_26767/g.31140  ORF Transcript_26767/g.31140 Transcript_26767/m.31140 type:complete len:578 (+) Transcript_26767:28-1761(+)